MRFQCLRCGKCCHEVPFVESECSYKRIPLYPEEANRLEKIAKERGIKLHLIEDLVFPDELNKQIILVTWRILLDNEEKVCPFHQKGQGCTIHEEKPLACKSFPLALQTIDAFNTRIDIDPLCEFTIQNRDVLEKANAKEIEEIYGEEYKNVEQHLKRNKKVQYKLRIFEQTGKRIIPKQITGEKFDECLRTWPRWELR